MIFRISLLFYCLTTCVADGGWRWHLTQSPPTSPNPNPEWEEWGRPVRTPSALKHLMHTNSLIRFLSSHLHIYLGGNKVLGKPCKNWGMSHLCCTVEAVNWFNSIPANYFDTICSVSTEYTTHPTSLI